MATYTATQAVSGVQPKGNHNGVDAVKSTLDLSSIASLSATDVILWGRVPNGSTLLNVQQSNAGAAGNALPLTYEIDGVTLGSATALSLGLLASGVLPMAVSLSDDALGSSNLSAILKSTAGAITSATAAGTISRTMYLTRDA